MVEMVLGPRRQIAENAAADAIRLSPEDGAEDIRSRVAGPEARQNTCVGGRAELLLVILNFPFYKLSFHISSQDRQLSSGWEEFQI